MDDCWIPILLFLLAVVFAGGGMGLLVWALNRHLLILIAGVVHILTIMTACSHSVPAAVLTMFTPGLSQIYWVGSLWTVKGTIWHPLTYMCAALLASLAIEIVGRRAYAKQIAGTH